MGAFTLISFASFLVSLGFGVIVFSQDVRNRVNRSFFLLSLAVAYWALCEYHLRNTVSHDTAMFWGRAFVFWPFAVSFFAQFLITFTDPDKRRSAGFWAAIHLPAAVLSLLGLFTDLVQKPPVKVAWGYAHGLPETLAMRLIISGWAVVIAGYCLRQVLGQLRRAPTDAGRKRAIVVLWGMALPVVAGLLTEAALPQLGFRVPEFTSVAFAVCCLVFGYGMWKHRLFQLSVELAAPSVVSAMPDALLVLDARGRIASVNRAATELFDRPESKLLGMPIRELVPQLDPAKRDTVVDREVTAITGSDQRVLTSMAWAPLLSDSGQCDGHTVVLRDLTARKRAEALRDQARALSDSIMDSMPGVFYLIDSHGRFIRWNPNLEQVTGYTADELHVMAPTDVVRSEDRAILTERIAEVFAQGASSVEAQLLFKDGNTAPYFFTGRRVVLQGEPYLVGMGIDISERKRLEGELIQSQKMQAVGTLAGGIAHDFNNLLTVILGSAEIATATSAADNELRQDLEQITIAGKSAARLTRQLLQFSRKQVMQPQAADLRSIFEPLTSMLQRLIGEDIHLELQFPKELWPVDVDLSSIEQVVVNLVVNARDALPDGGQIVLSAENRHLKAHALSMSPAAPAGPYVRLSIVDNGTGLSDDARQHLFEPFFTTKAKGRGTGLGLSVVYGIVRQHDGWIQAVSEPGKGTRFEVYLPRSSATPKVVEESQDKTNVPSLEGVRILLIEDESAVLRFTTVALRRVGCEVTAAAGFLEGLATFEDSKDGFDLVFSDVILPDGNGLELAQQIRASHPDLPVLMTSGYTGDRARVEDILGEELRFLQKPYKLADLYRQVAAAVAERARDSASRVS